MASATPGNSRSFIEASGLWTPFGDGRATLDALLAGRRALQFSPVQGNDGDQLVPLALGHPLIETAPPSWMPILKGLAAAIPAGDWGSSREPVIFTSSNFGVGSHHAYRTTGDAAHLAFAVPTRATEFVRTSLGWGANTFVFSHACVSAHLGLMQAARLLDNNLADRVLVFSFDFLSPFVTGGFCSLKILNDGMPAPYQRRETGSIGLGDGAAFAILSREQAPFAIEAQSLHNEMYHFTSNQPDGAGFDACAGLVAALTGGRKLWVKGHGTGTLEAGRLEAEAVARHFPGSPLVGWKGSLGHTLGSCGLVELAIAIEAFRAGRTPGTVGSEAPCFTDEVAVTSFDNSGFDGAALFSNAFGGAHAGLILSHA